MKKFLYSAGAALLAAPVLAEGGAAQSGVSQVLTQVEETITNEMTNAWTIIVSIVGIGLLIWLGRALLRAVRSYFSTAM